jgi:hypothetical protein
MPKKLTRAYLVSEKGSEDRLVEARNELAVFKHIDKAITISIPTKDQIIALLRAGVEVEDAHINEPAAE